MVFQNTKFEFISTLYSDKKKQTYRDKYCEFTIVKCDESSPALSIKDKKKVDKKSRLASTKCNLSSYLNNTGAKGGETNYVSVNAGKF